MYFDQSGLALVGQAEDGDIAGLESEYMQTQCVLADGGDRYGVCALAFDQSEELLWMGNQGGHVTSYYMGHMQKYTSFQIHANQEVRQIETMNEGILALTASSLRCQIRRGIPVFTHTSSNMKDMQCMLQLSQNRLLIAGHSDNLIDFNMGVCKETRLVDVGNAGCVMLRSHSRYVCAGNPLGQIDLRDPNTLNVEHTLKTHSGSLSDFDVQGNLLVTCGFTNRQGNLSVDRFLMVHDLRMMRGAMSPIQTVVDPLYLRFLPSVSSRLSVVSALGQVQLLDTVPMSEPRLCLVNVDNPGTMCLAFDISASSQALCLGYDTGSLHLLASTSEPQFNSYARHTEHADEGSIAGGAGSVTVNGTSVASFALDDYDTPLSTVPMPAVVPMAALSPSGDGGTVMSHRLASDWPSQLMRVSYRRTPPIDAEILRTMKLQGPIGYAPNPKATKRNQVQYDLEKNGSRAHIKQYSQENRKVSTPVEDSAANFVAIPKRYRKIDVKFNKLGTEDFLFDQYNKTGLPGLEAVLPNAYCNAMIQVLYYTEPVRATLLSHLCTREFCLACELGFLFHMLSTTAPNFNSPCQPGNFLRAFRTVPEASALGLILSDLHGEAKQRVDLGALIQSWNRFMVHQMHGEILETRKQRREDNKSGNSGSSGGTGGGPGGKKATAPFVYKDADFPSMLGNVSGGGERKRSPSNASDVVVSSSTTPPKAESTTTGKQEEEKRITKEEEEDLTTTEISQLFGMRQLHTNRCLKCTHEVKKESTLLACNLVYPSSSMENEHREEWTFCDILTRSLTPRQTTPAWCDSCDKFQPTSQMRILQSLPKLLAINTGLHNPQHKLFWQSQMDKIVARATNLTSAGTAAPVATAAPSPTYSNALAALMNNTKPCRYGDNCSRPGCRFRHSFDTVLQQQPPVVTSLGIGTPVSNPYCSNNWLPHRIAMSLSSDGALTINKLEPEEQTNNDSTEENNEAKKNTYNLTAVVCYVHEQNERKNLVALIKIPRSYLTEEQNANSMNDRWYLFNDFSICTVPSQEATWFSLDWKTPCVLYYSTPGVCNGTTPIATSLSKEVFTQDNCIARSGGTSVTTFTPLAEEEFPKPGELVAMDAEFVTLNQEESELRSDGKMSTIKPSQMSVARITCIRGQGSHEGTPFIDDYISTQEQVVDYLTKFSGIKPGDLDANFSSKHLTTLKSTYVKLRFLVDSGVIFVGHGLKNDFRVINLVIPPEQVVDTVLLFHLPHHRMVSLRFLAWHFLGLKIQSVTHDSTEDARAALQLYRRYKQLEADSKVGDALSELYETGKILNWKVPED